MSEAPYQEHRRSTRLRLELSIEVDGEVGSLPLKGVTVVVSLHGALIRTTRPLSVGSKVYVRVLMGEESIARVVRAVPPNPLTYAIELEVPRNIWGVEVEPDDWVHPAHPETNHQLFEQPAMPAARKREYTPPKVQGYKSVNDLPEKFRTAAAEILEQQPALKVVLDENHRYVSVSEEFARLLGYTGKELVGKTVDEITAKDTVDIDFAFRVSQRLGEMQGLWLFQRRDGKKLLCSYRAERANSAIKAELRPVLVAA